MAFNTGNPIGSTSPRDLSDNAENFDRFANGNAAAYDDRLGVSRKSISGMESEFAADQSDRATTFANFLASSGYVGTGAGGAYEDYDVDGPLTINARNEIFTKGGEFYKAKASLSLPYTTTGTWVGDDETRFVSVGDAALRQELSSNSNAQGSDLVAHTGTDDTVTEALNKRTIYVGSVAEGVSGLTLPDGTEISVTGWHDGSEVGGGEFVFRAGVAKSEHNGGTIISPTVPALSAQAGATEDDRLANYLAGAGETDASGSGCFVRRYEDLWLEYFGAKGNNSQNTSVPFDAARLFINQFSPSPSLGGTASTTATPIHTRQAQYLFKTPQTLGGYVFVKGNNATFSAPAGGRIFESTQGYRYRFEEVTFYGNDIEALNGDMPNLENAKFEFIRCDFSTYTVTPDKFSLFLRSRSSRVVFDECQVRVAPNFLEVEADFVYLKGGWVRGSAPNEATGGAKPADSESFRILGGTRKFHINETVFIPEAEGAVRQDKARWITNYGNEIFLNRAQFGGENSGIPIIYQFKQGGYQASNRQYEGKITVRDSSVACGSNNRTDAAVVVLQDGVLPGYYDFEGLNTIGGGMLISAAGYDYAGTDATRNTALFNALSAAPGSTLQQIKIVARDQDYEKTMPTSLYPFSFYNPRGVLPVTLDTAIPLVEAIRPTAAASGEAAFKSYIVDLQFFYIQTGPKRVSQRKRFRVFVEATASSTMTAKYETLDFSEYAPLGDGAGDTVLTLSTISSTTNLLVTGVTISSTNITQSAEDLRAQIYEENLAESSNAIAPTFIIKGT